MHYGHVRNRRIGITGMFATGASASTHAREVVGRRAVGALKEHGDAVTDFATSAGAAPAGSSGGASRGGADADVRTDGVSSEQPAAVNRLCPAL